MRTLAATLLLLGFAVSSASAQYCAPGSGYQRPSLHRAKVLVENPQQPEVAPPAPAEPAPVPAPAQPVPQK